jgi:hypothetical protein
MGMTYFDVLKMEFGRKEFSISDLTKLTGNYGVRKLLSEMKMKGLIRRTGRGTYVIDRPIKKVDSRVKEWERVRGVVFMSPFEKAWTGSTAVEVWTDGAYVTAPNSYLRIYHLLVREADLEKWKTYLKKHAVSFKGSKRVGSYVALEGADEVRSVLINGEPVVPKEDVMKIIREHPGLYAEAEDLIAY